MTNNYSSLSSATQCKVKEKKLTKGGRVQSVPRDIEDGNGTMELMLKQVMTMAHWSSH
jgi:hypothetical protein